MLQTKREFLSLLRKLLSSTPALINYSSESRLLTSSANEPIRNLLPALPLCPAWNFLARTTFAFRDGRNKWMEINGRLIAKLYIRGLSLRPIRKAAIRKPALSKYLILKQTDRDTWEEACVYARHVGGAESITSGPWLHLFRGKTRPGPIYIRNGARLNKRSSSYTRDSTIHSNDRPCEIEPRLRVLRFAYEITLRGVHTYQIICIVRNRYDDRWDFEAWLRIKSFIIPVCSGSKIEKYSSQVLSKYSFSNRTLNYFHEFDFVIL